MLQFKDQFTAFCILIFVTLEHHRSSTMAHIISILLFATILLNAVCLVVGTIRSTMYVTACQAVLDND